MKNCKPSDKDLNALLDSELDADKARRMEQLLRQNPAMRRHVDELREVRGLVRLAFDTERDTPARAPVRRRGWWMPRFAGMAVAALLLIAVGMGIGWSLNPAPALDAELAARGAYLLRAHLPTAGANPNILLHINGHNEHELLAALDETEKLLARYQALHRAVRFEVIANGGGINLLKSSEGSVYAKRIRELQERYKNLTFLACRNTVELLKARHVGDVHMLPGVVVGPSAIEHVMKRLNEGWAYIKV